MALPRFFSRVADAVGPVAAIAPVVLAERLRNVRVVVSAGDGCGAAPRRDGLLLAVNLLARLYPRVEIIADPGTGNLAAAHGQVINPELEVHVASSWGELQRARDRLPEVRSVVLCMGENAQRPEAAGQAEGPVHVVECIASGWNVLIDRSAEVAVSEGNGRALRGLPLYEPAPAAALAAAAVGVGEVFRAVFAVELGEKGRTAPQPGGFNLITGGKAQAGPDLSEDLVDVGVVHLVGAGAVGQACVLTLSLMPLTGELVVVDPQHVELSNLQRYVLTVDADEGASKTALVARALAGTHLTVSQIPAKWGEHDRTGPGQDTVLVALDSAVDRLAVAAGLPGRAYNAWTQPQDLGWSRHEAFGASPCLACLYYPDRPRPSDHEVIATALGQHPLRMLSYLMLGMPVGLALPAVLDVAGMPLPIEAPAWTHMSLLDDLIAAGVVDRERSAAWAGQRIGQLYRDGVCAGGLLAVGQLPTEVLVPLAHQSALAGIALATSLLAASDPSLRDLRGDAVEYRFDVLRGLPQVLPRPRERTASCFCSDADYVAAASGWLND